LDLTNDDVADILALLDSLPYDSLDVQTPRFRLTLRRAPDGGWTEEAQVLADPVPVTPAPDGAASQVGQAAAVTGVTAAAVTGLAATAAPQGTGEVSGAEEAAGAERATGAGSATAPGPAAGPGDPPPAAGDADGLAVVTAPLPGTFYRAPRPGAEPFVQVGDEVAADTVVAIIETMKLMNSVHAGTAGRVARICAGNGEFTAPGATLLLIEPAP
jgi:acetyl-CoA carboxylase biotin carboxyl carrier protein